MRSPSRPAARASSAPATCASARRPWSRPSPRDAARPTPIDAYLQGQDLDAIRTRQTLAEPQPEFLSIVPYTGEVKEPRYRLKAMPRRGAQQELHRVRDPVHAAGGDGRVRRCLQCTCEAIGYCDLRRQGIEYGTTLKTLEPERTGFSASERDREPLHRHQPRLHPRRHATPSSCASRRAASTAAAAPTCARRSSAPPATTSCARASTRWSRRRST